MCVWAAEDVSDAMRVQIKLFFFMTAVHDMWNLKPSWSNLKQLDTARLYISSSVRRRCQSEWSDLTLCLRCKFIHQILLNVALTPAQPQWKMAEIDRTQKALAATAFVTEKESVIMTTSSRQNRPQEKLTRWFSSKLVCLGPGRVRLEDRPHLTRVRRTLHCSAGSFS